jgi:hypothetical protein
METYCFKLLLFRGTANPACLRASRGLIDYQQALLRLQDEFDTLGIDARVKLVNLLAVNLYTESLTSAAAIKLNYHDRISREWVFEHEDI